MSTISTKTLPGNPASDGSAPREDGRSSLPPTAVASTACYMHSGWPIWRSALIDAGMPLAALGDLQAPAEPRPDRRSD